MSVSLCRRARVVPMKSESRSGAYDGGHKGFDFPTSCCGASAKEPRSRGEGDEVWGVPHMVLALILTGLLAFETGAFVALRRRVDARRSAKWRRVGGSTSRPRH